MPRRIEAHLLDGPAGKLEALLEPPEDADPRAAALVCHPHPLFGGTMHNKVVHRTARALRNSGHVVLRFNFRGVGKSEGRHDLGVGEIEDARAALDWLLGRYPGLPYTLAGFSFGSRVVLALGCALQNAACVIAIGFPAKRDAVGVLASCTVPERQQRTNGEVISANTALLTPELSLRRPIRLRSPARAGRCWAEVQWSCARPLSLPQEDCSQPLEPVLQRRLVRHPVSDDQ